LRDYKFLSLKEKMLPKIETRYGFLIVKRVACVGTSVAFFISKKIHQKCP
jgi:hypothetical protein